MATNHCDFLNEKHYPISAVKLVIDTRKMYGTTVYETYIVYDNVNISLHNIDYISKFNIPEDYPVFIVVLTENNEDIILMPKLQASNFIWYLNGYPSNGFHIDCHRFTQVVHYNEVKPFNFDNNILAEDVKPLSVVRVIGNNGPIHSALYVTNNLFLSKFGIQPWICGISKDKMLKIYPGELQYSRQ